MNHHHRSVFAALLVSMLASGCGTSTPPDCEVDATLIAESEVSSEVGFAWTDVGLPAAALVPGSFQYAQRSTLPPGATLELELRTEGAVTENAMFAHEPSHFSEGVCASDLTRAANVTLSTSDGTIAGTFQGRVRALAPDRYAVVVRAPGATVTTAEDVPAYESIDLVIAVVDGRAHVELIGVDELPEEHDEHGGTSSGATLTTLFEAEDILLAAGAGG